MSDRLKGLFKSSLLLKHILWLKMYLVQQIRIHIHLKS